MDVKVEKSDLAKKMKTLLGETDLEKGGNNRLSLRQRQAKVNRSEDVTVINMNMKDSEYSQDDILETFQVFKGEVENPMV